jgi:hypothetical protein
LVALQSGAGEALAAVLAWADMLPLPGVDRFDAVRKALVDGIVLVVAVVVAHEGSRIGVGGKVIPESRREVEDLGAAWPCTCQLLEVRREFGWWVVTVVTGDLASSLVKLGD